MIKKKNSDDYHKLLTSLFVMVFVVMALLVWHFLNTRSMVADTIAGELYATADGYAEELREQIETMTEMAVPVAKYLETKDCDDEQFWDEVATICTILQKNTKAEKVLICSPDGVGCWNDGEKVDATLLNIWPHIFDGSGKHIFREEAEEGQILISCIPFLRNGQSWCIVMYYDLKAFQRIIKSSAYAVNSFVALTDRNGKIILDNGSDSKFLQQEGFLDYTEGATDEAVVKFKTRMKSKSKAYIALNYQNEKRVIYEVPVNVSDMYVVMGVNQSFVNRRTSSLTRRANLILQILMLVVVVYAGIMTFSVFSNKVKVSRNKMELEEKADTDLLTGLYNKLATERKIKDYMADHPDTPGMMVLLDLDNFKKINDTKGHAFGDEVLRTLGMRLSSLFRSTDIVGRIGGDEFMVFIKGISDAEDVMKQSGKIVKFFRDFQVGDYVKYSATASIGVGLYPKEGTTFEELYKAADKALYISKNNGKNQVAFMDEELNKMAKEINRI